MNSHLVHFATNTSFLPKVHHSQPSKLSASEPSHYDSASISTVCNSLMDQFGMSSLLPLNDSVKLQRAVEPGGIVVVQSASWDPNPSLSGDNTNVNFLNNNGDYLLHVSLRQGANVIVFNARTADGDWGSEERLSLTGTFVKPCFNIAIWDQGDRYGILFGYQLFHSFKKRFFGLISNVSYYTNSTSPLSEALVLSTLDAMEEIALTNDLACSDVRPLPPLVKYANPIRVQTISSTAYGQ
jgi:hypothetical protein